MLQFATFLGLAPLVLGAGDGDESSAHLQPIDVFDLEYASDPRISPDGSQVVYARNFMDIMEDRRRSNLWLIDIGSGEPWLTLPEVSGWPTSPRSMARRRSTCAGWTRGARLRSRA